MIRHLPALLVPVALGAAGCPSVDCEALCQRTLACEVTFAPSDDADELKVDNRERPALESCAHGCQESPTVTVESASCIDELEITGDPAQCQPGVVDCLGLTEALAGDDTSGGVG